MAARAALVAMVQAVPEATADLALAATAER